MLTYPYALQFLNSEFEFVVFHSSHFTIAFPSLHGISLRIPYDPIPYMYIHVCGELIHMFRVECEVLPIVLRRFSVYIALCSANTG